MLRGRAVNGEKSLSGQICAESSFARAGRRSGANGKRAVSYKGVAKSRGLEAALLSIVAPKGWCNEKRHLVLLSFCILLNIGYANALQGPEVNIRSERVGLFAEELRVVRFTINGIQQSTKDYYINPIDFRSEYKQDTEGHFLSLWEDPPALRKNPPDNVKVELVVEVLSDGTTYSGTDILSGRQWTIALSKEKSIDGPNRSWVVWAGLSVAVLLCVRLLWWAWPNPSPPSPPPPVPVLPYRIVGELPPGGLATASLVKRYALGNTYVMKTLRASYGSRPEFVLALRDEATVLERLQAMGYSRAPKLVGIGGALNGDSDNPADAWFVMTYVSGIRLIDSLGALEPVQRRIRVLADLARAVVDLHACGVVHRDLSPENVMIRFRAGKPRINLIDFGSASEAGQAHALGSKWVLKHQYAAPEQIRRGLSGASMPADAYAVGIMACELMLNEHPFVLPGQQPSYEDHVRFDRDGVAYRLRQAGVQDDVALILCRYMLHADPDQRCGVSAFLTALRGAYRFL